MKKKKPIKERKALQLLYDKLQQRRKYLNKHHKTKCTKGNLLEIELLQKDLRLLIKPIQENENLKVGDKFYLKENKDTIYVITSFPTLLEVSGVVEEYIYGRPLSIVTYFKDVIKVRVKKKNKKSKSKKK